MSVSNEFVSFLRHYGPIAASDNMYDELIQAEIERRAITKPIEISPAFLRQIISNFECEIPRTIILTGTAGDGKTFHCRSAYSKFGGDVEAWNEGSKVSTVSLPKSSKLLRIVKDLSELTLEEKNDLMPQLASAVAGKNKETVFLVAANDGQLLASWREWAEANGQEAYRHFKTVEEMLVDEIQENPTLELYLFNLSRLDASGHFEEIVDQVVEHPQWDQCAGCELLDEDGNTTCPIRINRERLRRVDGQSLFRDRLGQLLKLSRSNRMHLPIRDLLLLGVNILLGDRQSQGLLTCRMAKNRAKQEDYRLTNPYANVFGSNLPERQRQQYQAFAALEAFGIGRETDNKIDNLLIYGPYNNNSEYDQLVQQDDFYGGRAYKRYLRDYLEGDREDIHEFMLALIRQRQRLFFTLPAQGAHSPWALSVYQSAGAFLEFSSNLASGEDTSGTTRLLVRGLNRTFSGMMIDEGSRLFLSSSGGDGRGRIASILKHEVSTTRNRRDPYLEFSLGSDDLTPKLQIIDPAAEERSRVIDSLELQVTHFEYLMRVAKGSLPASFSRQCYEDFLDFKLRVIDKLDEILGEEPAQDEVNLQAVTVDSRGRPQPETIRIQVGKE